MLKDVTTVKLESSDSETLKISCFLCDRLFLSRSWGTQGDHESRYSLAPAASQESTWLRQRELPTSTPTSGFVQGLVLKLFHSSVCPQSKGALQASVFPFACLNQNKIS